MTFKKFSSIVLVTIKSQFIKVIVNCLAILFFVLLGHHPIHYSHVHI